MRFVSLVKFLAAFLLAPWREAGEINSSNLTLSKYNDQYNWKFDDQCIKHHDDNARHLEAELAGFEDCSRLVKHVGDSKSRDCHS